MICRHCRREIQVGSNACEWCGLPTHVVGDIVVTGHGVVNIFPMTPGADPHGTEKAPKEMQPVRAEELKPLTPALTCNFASLAPVLDAAISPQGDLLILANRIGCYALEIVGATIMEPKLLHMLTNEHIGASSVAFDKGGDLVAVGGLDHHVYFGRVSRISGRPKLIESAQLQYLHPNEITSLSISNSGKWLASGCSDGTVSFLFRDSPDSLRFRVRHTRKRSGPVKHVGFGSDDRLIFTLHKGSGVYLWGNLYPNSSPDELAAVDVGFECCYITGGPGLAGLGICLEGGPVGAPAEYSFRINNAPIRVSQLQDECLIARYSVDSNYLLCSHSSRVVTLWQREAGELIQTKKLTGSIDHVKFCLFGALARIVVTVSTGGAIDLFEVS